MLQHRKIPPILFSNSRWKIENDRVKLIYLFIFNNRNNAIAFTRYCIIGMVKFLSNLLHIIYLFSLYCCKIVV